MQKSAEFAEDNKSEEQSGFRTGKRCVDHIFNMRKIMEKILLLLTAFIDLEKVDDRLALEIMWNVLKI